MSNWVVALFAALGVAGWLYPRVDLRTAHNTQNTLTVCGVAGLAVFIVVFTLLNMFFG